MMRLCISVTPCRAAMAIIMIITSLLRLKRSLHAVTQSGCGYPQTLFKYIEVYATVWAVDFSARIVQLLHPSFNAFEWTPASTSRSCARPVFQPLLRATQFAAPSPPTTPMSESDAFETIEHLAMIYRPAPHGCVFHALRCDPPRCVHAYTIVTDRNATHEERIRVGRG